MADRRTAILAAARSVIARRGVRGLRMEEVGQEAGVALSLIYYYFDDRAGLLRQTLEFVNQRADHYTAQAIAERADAREALELMLALEFQDDPAVVENATAWGELRASAIFDPELQEQLDAATAAWIREVAAAVERAQRASEAAADHRRDAAAIAERLTALVEGLSERWLGGSLSIERAHTLIRDAVAAELDQMRSALAGER